MILNIIMAVTMYPVVFIMYFFMRWIAKSDNGYCFGAVLRGKWREEPQVKSIRQEFLHKLNLWLLVSVVVPVAAFFIPYVSISMTIWMIWLLAVVFYPSVPFFRANKMVRQWKQEQGYVKESTGVSYTELKQAGAVRRVRFLPFLIPAIVGFAAPLCGTFDILEGFGNVRTDWDSLLWCLWMFAVLGLFFWWCAWCMDRQRTEVISTDSEINLNYARAKKNIWKNLWLFIFWLNTALNWILLLLFAFSQNWVGGLIGATVLYGVFTIAAVVFAITRIHQLSIRYEKDRTMPEPDDSDSNWIGGMFYYNKKDRHVMVEHRNGFGITMNMATPVGMGVTVFACLALLVIPVMCVWLILDEFTPIHVTVEDQTIVAHHLKTDYEIPLSEITDVEILNELPNWTKVNGTGMDNLEKGTFEIYREGKCKVFLNPQNTMFLKITADDTVYYIGGYDDAETKEVYEEIKPDE